MLSLLARLTTAQVPAPALARLPDASAKRFLIDLPAQTPPAAATSVPIYSNFKALTFPILVGLVKGAWTGVKLLPVPWFATMWFPFVACMVLGLLITASDVQVQKGTLLQTLGNIAVGILNSIVTFAAVLGISGGS